jgi:hypothetical protein
MLRRWKIVDIRLAVALPRDEIWAKSITSGIVDGSCLIYDTYQRSVHRFIINRNVLTLVDENITEVQRFNEMSAQTNCHF